MKTNKKYIVIIILIIIFCVGKSTYDAYQVKGIYEEAEDYWNEYSGD